MDGFGGEGKKGRAPALPARGPVDPAATYSPGPEGQVPSATAGLTSVFGMGTGMTLRPWPPKNIRSMTAEEKKQKERDLAERLRDYLRHRAAHAALKATSPE